MLENFFKGNHFKMATATMQWLWRIMELEGPREELAGYLYDGHVGNLCCEGLHPKSCGMRRGVGAN
jgi:hypothetical protein